MPETDVGFIHVLYRSAELIPHVMLFFPFNRTRQNEVYMDGRVFSFARSESYEYVAGRPEIVIVPSFLLSEPHPAPTGEPSFFKEGTVEHLQKHASRMHV